VLIGESTIVKYKQGHGSRKKARMKVGVEINCSACNLLESKHLDLGERRREENILFSATITADSSLSTCI